MKMDEKEIKKLIEKGESQKVEFKEKFDNETMETAVAFANSNGGIILIGIDDKEKIKGVSTGRETKYAITRHKPDINPTNALKEAQNR